MPAGWETKACNVCGLVPKPTVEMPRFSSMSKSKSASAGSWSRISAMSVYQPAIVLLVLRLSEVCQPVVLQPFR